MSDVDTETEAVPSLETLDEEGVSAIHEASMHVVENVGIRLGHERARELLAREGATVDGEVVTVPREIVEDCVADAPSEFTLHARNAEKDVTVGGGRTPVRAPGHGPAHVRTYDGGRRRSQLSDYEALVKLSLSADAVTCTGYRLGEPNDVADDRAHVGRLARSLRLSDMPVMGSAYGERRAQTTMDMVGMVTDDPDLRRPYVAGLVNTVPPRSIEREALAGLLTYAEHGQPPVVSSLTVAGASGPASLAGSMAQANAENLVAITLTQLVERGTPVIYGVPSSGVDTRYGSLSVGSPESALFVSVAAQMGEFYGVPSRGGGGLTDSKSVDYQGGFESMLLQAVTDFAGVDFVLHAAGILESYATVSPEKFLLDCEAIRYLDRFREGFSVDEESLAVDAIEQTEPAGHFLGTGHSAGDREFFRSAFVDKRSHDDWAADGEKSAFEAAHERVQNRLDAYERPELDRDIRRDLDRYVERHSPTC